MITLFCAERERFPDSENFIRYVFSERYALNGIKLEKTSNGKPYLTNAPYEISLSHTKTHYFLAVSALPVGVDAEQLERNTDYAPILKKFTKKERDGVQNQRDFLSLWTAKESVIKLLGGTLSRDLRKTVCDLTAKSATFGNTPVYLETVFPVGHVVTLSAESPFSVEVILL